MAPKLDGNTKASYELNWECSYDFDREGMIAIYNTISYKDDDEVWYIYC
jgi:hypothetical protein